jgi:hypothetical protein
MASRAEDLFTEIIANKGRIEEWLNEKKDEEWLEDEFLDFKSSDVIDRPSSGKKYEKFRDSLCEAISAFGNTEGGVVIYGIEAKAINGSRDVVQSLKPLNNCIEAHDYFRKIKLNLSTPTISGIQCVPVEVGRGNEGYLVFFIPKGEHQPYRAEHDRAYYQRTIDSCVIMNHEVLKAMFYPRLMPAYNLELQIRRFGKELSDIGVYAHLTNVGNATAENVVIRMEVYPHCLIGTFTEKDQIRHTSHYPTLTDQYSTDTMELENIHPGQLAVRSVVCTFSRQFLNNTNSGLHIFKKPLEEQLKEGVRIVLRIYSRNSSPVIYDTKFTFDELLTLDGQNLVPVCVD